MSSWTDLCPGLDVDLVLLDGLLDLLLHRVERLGVGLRRLLGRRLLELERGVDVSGQGGQDGEELGGHVRRRSRKRGEVRLLQQSEDLVELCKR